MKTKNYSVRYDKSLKSIYNASGIRIPISLSVEESIILEKMMKDDDWTNRSGFIKYKLFGWDSHMKYKKVLSATSKSDLEIIFKNVLDQFNRTLIYCSARFEKETIKLHEVLNANKKVLPKNVYKWLAIIEDYADDIKKQSKELFKLYFSLVSSLTQVVYSIVDDLPLDERERYLSCVPDQVLQVYVQSHQNDTTSDIVKEYLKRINKK